MSSTSPSAKYLEHPPIDVKLISDQDKKELIAADTVSIASGTTVGGPDLSFTPAKSFHVNTKGIPILRLPLPPSELVINVHNLDGSLAYQSTRERRSSGNCILTNVEGRELIGTTYFFGPGRDPVLTRLDLGGSEESTVKVASRWTSRSQKFLLYDGRTFEWAYKKAMGFGGEGKKGTALVLSVDGRCVAALIRNEETRTLGSTRCSAGNGGELVLGEEVGGKDSIGEALVVATCLLMLKKEVDRRRTVQIMMIAGAASSGP